MTIHSIKLANVLMVIAALALCISACTEPGAVYTAENSGVMGLTAPVTSATMLP